MQTIQSIDVPFWISEDGTTYKQLVCLTDYTLPLATQVTETDTFCGVAVGLGVVKFNPSVNATAEANPNASQWTWKDVARWIKNKTLLWFKLQYPQPASTGNNIFASGQCYCTQGELNATVNDAVKFSATFTGSGEIDIDPA